MMCCQPEPISGSKSRCRRNTLVLASCLHSTWQQLKGASRNGAPPLCAMAPPLNQGDLRRTGFAQPPGGMVYTRITWSASLPLTAELHALRHIAREGGNNRAALKQWASPLAGTHRQRCRPSLALRDPIGTTAPVARPGARGPVGTTRQSRHAPTPRPGKLDTGRADRGRGGRTPGWVPPVTMAIVNGRGTGEGPPEKQERPLGPTLSG